MSGKRGGKAAVRAAIEQAEPAQPKADAAAASAPVTAPEWMARAFDMRADGLWRKSKDQTGKDIETWLCGPFKVEAETRNSDGRAWGLLLSWHDRAGIRREGVFPRSLFTGECAELRARLADDGLTMSGAQRARQHLAEFLNLCGSSCMARSVARVGWHTLDGRRVFVLPERVFGETGERVVLQVPEGEPSLFNTAGTLEQWRSEVSRLCLGNSRLLFSASCAFGAPLLRLLGEDGGGFSLRGKSRIGKTTALRVAASVCGGLPADGAYGFIRQWRATGNGIEGVAAAHSDCLLLLDEMGQVDGKEVGETIYMLANGSGKIRGGRLGGSRPTLRFRVLFLSTGEVSLSDKMAEAGRVTKAGQEIRLVDVPADAGVGFGIFEDLHGEAGAGEFLAEVWQATTRSYGTALPAFLTWLMAEVERDDPAFVQSVRDRVATLLRGWLQAVPEAGGQVRSVGFRFALVGVAGELASFGPGLAGVTEWPPGAAAGAAETCFRAWLAERGTVGAAEDAQAVQQLRAFIAKHGAARFDTWEDASLAEAQQAEAADPNRPPPERFRTQQRAGWRRWQAGEGGRMAWRYYLTAGAMQEALTGLGPREATRTLARLGLIVPPASGADARKGVLAGLHRVPGQGAVRLYELAANILGSDDGTD